MPHAATSMRSASAAATSAAVRRFDITAATAVRRFYVATAATSAVRSFEVCAASTSSAARGFECPRLLLVLTLERLHLLRMLAL